MLTEHILVSSHKNHVYRLMNELGLITVHNIFLFEVKSTIAAA